MELRTFKYVGINADGKTVRGRIEALNRPVALKFLQTRNYSDLRLSEYHDPFAKLNQITIGKTVQTSQLIFFLKQLGSLLKAGVPLLSALELLSLQQEKHRLRMIYFELYQQVYNGLSFSKALSLRPKEFPYLLVLMVEIGEMSGDLPRTILSMADYYDKQTKIQSQLKGAIRMPLVYLGITVLIAAGMLLFVFPSISNLFSSFGDAQMPGITVFFIQTATFVKQYALYIFGGLALLILILMILDKKNPKFHLALTILLLKLPVFGPLTRMNNQVLIANSLAQMMENGVNSVKALQTVRSVLTNVVYKNLLTKTLAYVDDGWPFSKAFEESEYVDPIMARMIATGERTGDIPTLMKNLSSYYNDVSGIRIDQIRNTIQPILLILVYAIVGVMILALMLPMLSLGSQI